MEYLTLILHFDCCLKGGVARRVTSHEPREEERRRLLDGDVRFGFLGSRKS